MYVSHCCVFGLPADDVRFTLLCYGVFRGRCVFCIAAGGFSLQTMCVSHCCVLVLWQAMALAKRYYNFMAVPAAWRAAKSPASSRRGARTATATRQPARLQQARKRPARLQQARERRAARRGPRERALLHQQVS
jgi:hypothetical protein